MYFLGCGPVVYMNAVPKVACAQPCHRGHKQSYLTPHRGHREPPESPHTVPPWNCSKQEVTTKSSHSCLSHWNCNSQGLLKAMHLTCCSTNTMEIAHIHGSSKLQHQHRHHVIAAQTACASPCLQPSQLECRPFFFQVLCLVCFATANRGHHSSVCTEVCSKSLRTQQIWTDILHTHTNPKK